MATIKKFEEIEAWKIARQLCKEIFMISTNTLLSKDYKLKDQINGSSGSVMDNIAEGFERSSRLELINFITYAKGSIGELRSQLYRILDRNYINQQKFDELYKLTEEVGAKLGTWINYLNKTIVKGNKFKERLNLKP
jgi:four helix bundle protein